MLMHSHPLSFAAPALAAVLGLLLTVAPSRADAEAGRKIFDEFQDSIVSISTVIDVQVTVANFMRCPTVIGLAEQIERQERGEKLPPLSGLDEVKEPEEFNRLIRVVRTWGGSRIHSHSLIVGRNTGVSWRTLYSSLSWRTFFSIDSWRTRWSPSAAG